MSLSPDRISAAALASLQSSGIVVPADVRIGDTGKTGLELLLGALATAVVNEITENGEVTLTKGLAAWANSGTVAPQDGGATLQASLAAADSDGSYSKGKIA